MTRVRVLLAALAVFLLCPAAEASFTLSLSAPGADLNNVTVGQTITVAVTLSGLQSGESLDFLAATVEFDPAQFTASNLTAGLIVPDAAGLTLSAFPNAVDGNYDVLAGDPSLDPPPLLEPITENGVFFTFDLTATAAGSSQVGFSFVGGTFTGQSDIVGSGGAALQVNPVPAPAGLTLALSGLAAVAFGRRFRR